MKKEREVHSIVTITKDDYRIVWWMSDDAYCDYKSIIIVLMI